MTIINLQIQTKFLHQKCGHLNVFHDVEFDGNADKIHLTLEIDGYPVELVNNTLTQVCMSYPELLQNPIIWSSCDDVVNNKYKEEVYAAFDPDAIVDQENDGVDAADSQTIEDNTVTHDVESIPDEQPLIASSYYSGHDNSKVDDQQINLVESTVNNQNLNEYQDAKYSHCLTLDCYSSDTQCIDNLSIHNNESADNMMHDLNNNDGGNRANMQGWRAVTTDVVSNCVNDFGDVGNAADTDDAEGNESMDKSVNCQIKAPSFEYGGRINSVQHKAGDEGNDNNNNLSCKEGSSFFLKQHDDRCVDTMPRKRKASFLLDEIDNIDSNDDMMNAVNKRAAYEVLASNQESEASIAVDLCEQQLNRLFNECMDVLLNPLDFMKKGL
ncbi:hypothetical protein G6F42_010291 [Rhizopus arrhizus]|nr:hypothetical protein G6F42_010291 [Rhizopus arrhizus]